MTKTTLLLIALMTLPFHAAWADDEKPNIEPGEWRMTSNITMEGPIPIPPQEDVSTECITQEEIDDGMAFVNDDDTCDITEREFKRDSASISMTCDTDMNTAMTMQMDMQFGGDSMTAEMSGDMQTPMGAMSMNMTMAGERLGDC
ncbi:MAG: DUF3617 family protein [Pseudomonadota bacterium]